MEHSRFRDYGNINFCISRFAGFKILKTSKSDRLPLNHNGIHELDFWRFQFLLVNIGQAFYILKVSCARYFPFDKIFTISTSSNSRLWNFKACKILLPRSSNFQGSINPPTYSRSRNFQTLRPPHFESPRLQNSQTSKLPNSQTSKHLIFWTSKLLNF